MRVLRVLASLMVAVTSLAAGERQPEYSAYLGYRGGGSLDATTSGGTGADAGTAFTWGLSGGWWVRPDAWLEVLFDRQVLEFDAPGTAIGQFDVNVDYLQFGGGYQPHRDGVKPYVTMALGLSHFGSDPGSVSDSTGFSGSIAAGFKVPISKKTLFRLEARGWGAISSSSAAVDCGPGCSFTFSGEGWWQFGIRAAVAFCPDGTR